MDPFQAVSQPPIQIGVDSFVATLPDPLTGASAPPAERMRQLLEEVERADRAGLDTFGIGEHHRAEFLDAAPAIILAAAAARTQRIRLTSAVTVLSADDPVRVFQDFATIDLISGGRAELVVGRGSFAEAYPLFGHSFEDYDALFTEKLDLLLKIRDNTQVRWEGRFRAPLSGQGIYPRPLQPSIPIWLGVGGTPASFARAGTLGLPLMVALIGGEPHRFRPLIDLYRKAGSQAGHPIEQLKVGVHAIGYVADTTAAAADEFYPGYHAGFSRIGKERGWPPINRAHYDALLSPTGALLIGDPEQVAGKIASVHRALGGISRLTFQMSMGTLPHAKALHAIDLLGARVAPRVREILGSSGTDTPNR